MTPEEIVKALREKDCPGEPHGNRVSMFDSFAQIDCYRCVEDAIRAAIRERDAAWRDAYAACGHFHEMTVCSGDCPLRALLEEAGSNGKEES